MKDKDIDACIVKLKGRYPDEGESFNLKCKEMVYIMKGSGKIFLESKESSFTKGDLILIQPGEKYYWRGSMTMFISCTPAWYPEQHKLIK